VFCNGDNKGFGPERLLSERGCNEEKLEEGDEKQKVERFIHGCV